MKVAHITKLYFSVKEEKHTVAFARKANEFVDKNYCFETCSKTFKAMVFGSLATEDNIKASLTSLLKVHLLERGIDTAVDFAFDFTMQDASDGFWLDGYSGIKFYCVCKNYE